MARVIAIGPGGKPQAPKRDTRYAGVISAALQLPLDKLLLSPPCSNMEIADDVRRGIYRSCKHYCACGDPNCTRRFPVYCPANGMRLGAQAHIVRDEQDRLRVQFRIFDKKTGRAKVVEIYGSDRSKWPYDPKAKRSR